MLPHLHAAVDGRLGHLHGHRSVWQNLLSDLQRLLEGGIAGTVLRHAVVDHSQLERSKEVSYIIDSL